MNESANDIRPHTIEVLEPRKKEQKKKTKTKHKMIQYFIFLSFSFLGFINHLGYYLIITNSQQLATNLGNESLIACYPLALIIFSSLSRLINSKYFINISYYIRVIFLALYFAIGYITLFFILDNKKINGNNDLAFWFTLIPTAIVGTGESFGEVIILSYIGSFRGNYISGWNIGASLAGVSGSFISLLFKNLNSNVKYLYLMLAPISVLYLFIFIFVDCCGHTEKKSFSHKKKYMKFHEKKIQNNNEDENYKKKVLNCANFKDGIILARKYIINLALINFLQYTICYCFCERSNKYKFINSKGTIFESAQYESILLFYQLGVVISNSSLFIIKNIKRVEIFTYLQAFNFILWFLEALFGYVSNQWICFIHLFFVGFCGGGENIILLNNMFNSKHISKQFQELCLNISEFFMDWGILLSSVFSIILDNTYLKIYK
jgi:hypothetical protein